MSDKVKYDYYVTDTVKELTLHYGEHTFAYKGDEAHVITRAIWEETQHGREWQPISSAPKDGTLILVSGLDYGKGPKRHYSIAHWGKFSDGRDGFMPQFEDELLEFITHWMNITPPPTAGESK